MVFKPLVILGGIGVVSGTVYVCRKALSGDSFELRDRLDGKTVVVTGASSGIGRETALQCAQSGARVIMACRNMLLCQQARKQIISKTKNEDVECRYCDFSSKKSIKEFADAINMDEPRLDVLVNNAGVRYTRRTISEDGIELQLFVNHMARHLLTNLLLDKLKSSQPSRIINLVDLNHQNGKIDFSDLNCDDIYNKYAAFYQSQLATMMFTVEMSRRLAGTSVTCNAVYPGMCKTNITRHQWTYKFPMSLLTAPFSYAFFSGARLGATTVTFAASSSELASDSGEMISHAPNAHINMKALDSEICSRLWQTSDLWTSLTN